MYPALFPVACLLRLWLRTLRIRVSAQDKAAWDAAGAGRLVVFWHNRLLVSGDLRRRFSDTVPMNGLISASKDGSWLAAFFRLLGIGTIRGSSSWRGGRAMLEIVRHLREGEDVAITPDGPRGPCYNWKPSAAQLALTTHCTVVLAGTRYSRGRRLASWDGFYLPAPFSRVDLVLDIVAPDDPARSLSLEDFSEQLRQRLMRITDDTGFPWTRKEKRRTPPFTLQSGDAPRIEPPQHLD
jgi:lysophospholipid acyltransferase (LPLAT)-like uncharacterized protein